MTLLKPSQDFSKQQKLCEKNYTQLFLLVEILYKFLETSGFIKTQKKFHFIFVKFSDKSFLSIPPQNIRKLYNV